MMEHWRHTRSGYARYKKDIVFSNRPNGRKSYDHNRFNILSFKNKMQIRSSETVTDIFFRALCHCDYGKLIYFYNISSISAKTNA